MKHIAKIYTDFPAKFGIPRQSGLVEELKAKIIFEKEYQNRDAVRGLEDFSHIWLLWEFTETERETWSPTVRPPKLGGNTRMGVFATRSPFRPNPIGLSCVRLERIEYTKADGPVLWVSGADLMNQTPIYDIKPYLPYTDAKPEASCGFTAGLECPLLEVEIESDVLEIIPEEKRNMLLKVLEQDPRPGYHTDSNRKYGFEFGKWEVKFEVHNQVLRVLEISETLKRKSE